MLCVSTQRVRGVPLRILRGDAATAEADHIARVVAGNLPGVVVAQPAARDLALAAVLVDRLGEDPVVVADAVADRRELQGRERIEVAGREPAEAAVAESGVGFLLRDAVEVVAEFRERRAGLLHQVAVEAGEAVDQRAAEQELDREVADALDGGLRDAPLRREPARRELLAHRHRERVVDVALGRRVRVASERPGQAVHQDGPQRARLQADTAQWAVLLGVNGLRRASSARFGLSRCPGSAARGD